MTASIDVIARIRSLLDYDRETGTFRWTAITSNRVKIGADAGWINSNGYRMIRVDGHQYMAHRLAWLIVHGRFPVGDIDHINGIRTDNRIANLREATRSLNMQNLRRARADSTTGVIGVRRMLKKWQAEIQVNHRKIYLGTFDSIDDARTAYLAAKRRLHPGNTL
jgi:hypothetical protein